MTRLNREMYRNFFTHTHTHTPNGEDVISMLGYADARRFGGRYAKSTESIPLSCEQLNQNTHTHTHTHTEGSMRVA